MIRFQRIALCTALLAAALGGLAPGEAIANDIDVTKFRPSPHPYDVLTVKYAHIPFHVSSTGSVFLHYSRDPLVFLRERDPDTGQRSASATT